jgi:hypothetical protein
MESWRVILAKRFHALVGENGLYSAAEMKAKDEEQGAYGHEIAGRALKLGMMLETSRELTDAIPHVKRRSVFASSSSRMPPPPPPPPSGSAGSSWRSAGYSPSPGAVEVQTDGLDDASTIGGDRNPISHSLAGSDTYGFTTTYELPTPRTIPSTPLVRRHVIAEIPLPTLLFTHILIPKLKAAAFLKAKVTNTSTIPLLQGQAGLTLDGSFMGNLTFPRCSPSETIVLELGVDQSVKVEYERPTVKHGTYGMLIMGKEEVGIYKVCPR